MRALDAKTSGNKAELINRLLHVGSSCEWAKTSENQESSKVGKTMDSPVERTSERSALQRELEISRRKKELVKRELELAKREIELLRGMQRLNVASGSEVPEENQRTNIPVSATGTSTRATEISARTTEMAASAAAARGISSNETPLRPNITSIAELLGSFDGRSDIYEIWERQVIFMKNTLGSQTK